MKRSVVHEQGWGDVHYLGKHVCIKDSIRGHMQQKEHIAVIHYFKQ